MENRNTFLGVKRNIVSAVHKVMLISILHSSVVAPSQNLVNAYLNYKEPMHYKGSDLNQGSLSPESTLKSGSENANPSGKILKPLVGKQINLPALIDAGLHYTIASDISSGFIGVSKEKPLDDAKDNLFKVYLKDVPTTGSKVYLTYDLFGAQDYTAVSRSINNRLSTGGYIVKNQLGWTTQKEEIDANWLKEGENRIMFGIPAGASYQYQIKNLKIEVDGTNTANSASALVVPNLPLSYFKDNKLYLKGFLRNVTSNNAKVYFEDTEISCKNGEFEGFLTLTDALKNRKFIIIKAIDNKGLLGQEIISLDNLIEADRIFPIEKAEDNISGIFKAKTAGNLQADGASITVNDSALIVDKEMTIGKLRPIDIAPMASGMINVTKGGQAYRFLPDGTKFEKPVMLSIAYDENLIPKGYTPNDIKTFYFNTDSKAWIAVRRDTINTAEKTILSQTTHFTDYVNGIIQTPESPETAGFTPTMMNDIKAADPSSEMTIISPPEVSQKGSANISYPIKIPAGRKGMQPQLAVQYSNDAGNSWLGQGWNISVPALSIDTRWGVPIMDTKTETEVYTLNGEQLMYPKYNNFDWMPNRHYDTSTVSPIYNTAPRDRISNAVFTPRKQGSFDKIERLGSNVDTYYWKVTSTNGTISWYGGKNGIVDNAIIRDANKNIVHWGLYMTEDVFGNCVKYVYDSQSFPNQSGLNANLNGGVIFHIKDIFYNGFNGDNYKYQIEFNVLKDIIRQDPSINARLGVKQIEPYFLDNIRVRKMSDDKKVHIRKYVFELNEHYGRFGKGQLQSVAELDKDDKEFYRHTFEYYDDIPNDGTDVYFTSGMEVSICNDNTTTGPCTDTDGDGVCDTNDGCINQPGPATNNGCPEESNSCFRVGIQAPSVVAYNYYSATGITYSNNEIPVDGCYMSSSRIRSLTLDSDPPFDALSRKIYGIHGTDTSPNYNKCPGVPITVTPNYAIENPYCDSKFQNLFSDFFTANNLSVYNFNTSTEGYVNLQNFVGGLQSVNTSLFNASFYSPSSFDLQISEQYGCGSCGSNNIVWDFDPNLPLTNGLPSIWDYDFYQTGPMVLAVNTQIFVNNSNTVFGTYDFSYPSQVSQFQADLNAIYPNTTVNYYVPNNYMAITTSNPYLLNIRLAPLNSNVSHTYQFNICSDSNKTVVSEDDWKDLKLSEDQMEYGIKKFQADGKELELPVKNSIANVIDATNNRKDNTLTGIFVCKQNDNSHIWAKQSGEIISDKNTIAKLDAVFYDDLKAQYEKTFEEQKTKELEKRRLDQQNAIAWLDEYRKKHATTNTSVAPKPIVSDKTVSNNPIAAKTKTGKTDYKKYFKDMADGYTHTFEGTVPINTDPDCPGFLNYGLIIEGQIPSFDSALSVLGTSVTNADSMAFYLGIGIGCRWYTKSTTIGVQGTWSKDSSNARIALVDINGDGLQDIVSKEFDGFMYYKAHQVSRTYDENNQPVITHSFGPTKPISGINNFYHASGGAKSVNFQITFGVNKVGGFVGKDKSSSKANNNVYFTDGNGDGLIDIVKNGVVYFNRLDGNNNPLFNKESKETENMVIIASPANVVEPAEEADDFTIPNYDVVKVWEAPANGTIQIDNTIQLTDTTKQAAVTIEMRPKCIDSNNNGICDDDEPCLAGNCCFKAYFASVKTTESLTFTLFANGNTTTPAITVGPITQPTPQLMLNALKAAIESALPSTTVTTNIISGNQDTISFTIQISNTDLFITSGNISNSSNATTANFITCSDPFDYDGDHLTGEADHCPFVYGPLALSGCPDGCYAATSFVPISNPRYSYEFYCNGSEPQTDNFEEDFENSPGFTGPVPGYWYLDSGPWMVFQNNSNPPNGTIDSWGLNTISNGAPHQGTGFASVENEVMAIGSTSEDWLSTPLITIPANGELHLFARLEVAGPQGTLYHVKVAPAFAPQGDPNSYIGVATWSEIEITNPTSAYDVYTEKTVDLSNYSGQQVYIAFIKEYTQLNPAISYTNRGDGWIIDDIRITKKCMAPTGLSATALTPSTALLSWNPDTLCSTSSWEVKVLPLGTSFTGTGTLYSGPLPYVVNLPASQNNDYKFYVRSVCSSTEHSEWVGPFNFNSTMYKSGNNVTTNSYEYPNQYCQFIPNKIRNLTFNTNTYTPSSPLFLTHYLNGGMTDLCPDRYNPDFVTNAFVWLNTGLSSLLDANSNLNVEVYPNLLTPCFYDGYKISFSSNTDITAFTSTIDRINPTNQSVASTYLSHNFTKNLLSSNGTTQPIYINGTLIGNFNLVDNPGAFETAFQTSYPGSSVEVTSSIVANQQQVTINICHTNFVLDTITVGTVVRHVHFTRATDKNNPEIPAASPVASTQRNINSLICTDRPTNLCLLFGDILNSSHSTVTNTIDHSSAACNPEQGLLTVKKGDRIYFRVHAVANGNPPVNWNPKVTYTNGNLATVTDQNGLTPYQSSYSDGFILTRNQPTAFPGNNGTATITWPQLTVANPSDDITFEVFHRKTVAGQANNDDIVTGDDTPIFTQFCPANSTTYVNATAALTNIAVSITGVDASLTLDDFYFKVTSRSNVDWKLFEWKPTLQCTVLTEVIGEGGVSEGTLTSNETLYPIVDYTIFKSFECSPAYALFDVAPYIGNPNLRIEPALSNLYGHTDHDGDLWFVIKNNNRLVDKRHIRIAHDAGGDIHVNYIDDNSPIYLSGLTSNLIEIGFYTDESNWFDGEKSLLSNLAMANHSIAKIFYNGGNVNVPNSSINLYQRPNQKFGPMLRQWGQFMYNPTAVTNATAVPPYGFLINESKLIYDTALATAINTFVSGLTETNVTETNIDTIQNQYNTLYSSPLLIATPTKFVSNGVLQERWKGMHDENYASSLAYRAATMEQAFGDEYASEAYEYQDVLQTGAYGINKITNGKNKNFSGGASVGGGTISAGANLSKTLSGDSKAVTDYIDFNGDRYPDLVTTNEVQYTMKIGGLFSPRNRNGALNISQSSSWGLGAQGSYSKGGDDGGSPKGYPKLHMSFEGFKGNAGGGLSINFSKGSSITNRVWTDINGDGLADLLDKDSAGNVFITLNYGYITDNNTYHWNLDQLFESGSTNIAGGGGVNKWNGSLEAGISITAAWNDSKNTLIDMNGDGLLDFVSSDDDINVRINQGNKFFDFNQVWSTENMKRESVSIGYNANVTATFAFVWYLPFTNICLKIPALSGSKSLGSSTTNKTKKTITDFDGDGYPDIVEQITNNSVRVYSSTIRRTDMLKSVTNPLGGKFTIDYKVEPVTYDNPEAKWTMSDLIIEDGYNKVNDGRDVYKKHFIYKDARYDRREREFYGFGTVKTQDYAMDEDNKPTSVYRTSVSIYHNRSYFLNGLVKEAYVLKGDDENAKYSRTENTYSILQLQDDDNNFIKQGPQVILPDGFDVGGQEGRRSAAVVLSKTVNYLYELSPTPQLTSETDMTYDKKGRVELYENKGNVLDPSDDYFSIMAYYNFPNNIISVPQSIQVHTGSPQSSGPIIRQRTTTANSGNGTITSIRALIDNSSMDETETTMDYDQYGNLVYIKYPENDNGQAMSYKYGYDDEYHKYIINIHDAYNYDSYASYNSSFDEILETKDLTGNLMKYEYDSFGRTIRVTAPKELALNNNNDPYTIKFAYYPLYSNVANSDLKNCVDKDNFMPFAVTNHFDIQHDKNDIETISFIDGLARPVQVKKDIELNQGTTSKPVYNEAMSISGKAWFDDFGRIINQFHPYFEDKDCKTNYTVNEYEAPYNSETMYDEMDRPVKTIDPDGNETFTEYSIGVDTGGAMGLKTKSIVDQNQSGAQIITETYKDVSGKVISTKNIGDNDLVTQFAYNAIGELMSYTDADNISTSYRYDLLGRKTSANHPDNGLTTFEYDEAGNLLRLQTANLANDTSLNPNDRFINYTYFFNRLVEVRYPNNPNGSNNISNVRYTFGNTGNGTGRMILQQDATGQQSFEYGNMGEMIHNKRTVVGPNMPSWTYNTYFSYDSWNRVQQMQYPDGEKVTYNYDLGGNLSRMTGEVAGSPYNYIDRIDYDYYEQRAYLLYGNQTETFYNYTPSIRRLENLNVKTSYGQDLFSNDYKYDKVGNVTNLANSANPVANGMGGKYSHDFTYDKFNRLSEATGVFDGNQASQQPLGNDYSSEYSLGMKYNNTHGIEQKSQKHTKNGVGVPANTYNNAYSYYDGTHQLKTINGGEENFKYDLNGNLTDKSTKKTSRRMFWDESNRLRIVNDANAMQHYIYDGDGERVLKANTNMEAVYENGTLVSNTVTINGYTTYPSAYIVTNQLGIYSKHYYAGSQRIVSRIGDQNANVIFIGDGGGLHQGKNSDDSNFDNKKLQKAQLEDLKLLAKKAGRDKVLIKEFKPFTYEEVKQQLDEENQDEVQPKAGSTQRYTPAMYFYHPDHLGTSTFLTDSSGEAYQFFLNLPFGETMAEQLPNSFYSTPYKFNGKELDEETGLYYHGARYYDPRISIWYSVDPMASKFPAWNPYNYTFENPTKYKDPTGMCGELQNTDPPKWLEKALKGQSAHRALTEYLKRIDPKEKTWRANKSVFAPQDITRPDVVYDNGAVGGVFELKPASPSPSSVKAAPEAAMYAKALNNAHDTDRFAPGTSGGAPSPFIGVTYVIDSKTGNKFMLTIPDPKTGAIFWTEIERPKVDEPVPVPVPVPVRVPVPDYKYYVEPKDYVIKTPPRISAPVAHAATWVLLGVFIFLAAVAGAPAGL